MTISLLSQLDFPFDIIRSKRKSAAIHVKAQRVEVRIPHHVDDKWALTFLHSKRQWVQRKLAEQDEHASARPVIEDGAELLWLGRPHRIQCCPNIKGVQLEDGIIRVGATNTTQAHTLLQDFFKHQAKQYLQARTWQLADQFGFDQKLQQIRFRRTKTKWGHCTSKGVIQYNWLIMGALPSVIDYLICHELSHLTHQNHSQRFWQLVARLCPEYKQQQVWLKANSPALSWC